MIVIVGFLLIILWLLILYHDRNDRALTFRFLMFLSVIDMINVDPSGQLDLMLKALFLGTVIVFSIKDGIKKSALALFFIALIIYFESLIHAEWTSQYNLSDSLTAFATFMTGLGIFSIYLTADERASIAKTLVLMPLFSVLIGIPLSILGVVDFLGRSGTALAGSSLDTNLAFFSSIAVMVCVTYFENNPRYHILAIINFLVACLTLTRMAILVSALVLLPEIFSFLKWILRDGRRTLLLLFASLLSVWPIQLVVTKLAERSFVNGELNTSGRSDAWSYILELTGSKWTGNGYGKLKTLTDNVNLRAFTAAHNEYIRAYFETGWIGLILLVLILVFVLHDLMKYRGSLKRISVLAIFIGFLLYSYTDNTIVNFRYWFMIMFAFNVCMDGYPKLKLRL